MLRMGRSNKPEQPEPEQAARPSYTTPPPSPAYNTSADTSPALPAAAPPPTATSSASSPAYTGTPTPPRAVSETDALARDLKDGLVGGFVGVHSVVSGETNFKGMLRVDGRVSGRIGSQDGTLIVSAGGQVNADIEVAVAKINGTVNGDIHARDRIEFGRTARVSGNIHTPALVIEQGAIFEGSCRMTAQPVAAEQARPRTANAAATNSAPPRNLSAPAPAVSKEAQPAPAPRATGAPADVAAAQTERERAAV